MELIITYYPIRSAGCVMRKTIKIAFNFAPTFWLFSHFMPGMNCPCQLNFAYLLHKGRYCNKIDLVKANKLNIQKNALGIIISAGLGQL